MTFSLLLSKISYKSVLRKPTWCHCLYLFMCLARIEQCLEIDRVSTMTFASRGQPARRCGDCLFLDAFRPLDSLDIFHSFHSGLQIDPLSMAFCMSQRFRQRTAQMGFSWHITAKWWWKWSQRFFYWGLSRSPQVSPQKKMIKQGSLQHGCASAIGPLCALCTWPDDCLRTCHRRCLMLSGMV